MPEEIIAFDYETHLIAPKCLAPKPVCITYAVGDESGIAAGDYDLRQTATALVEAAEEGSLLIAHNAKFDLGVMCEFDPSLLPRVFDLLESGKVHDTIIREKLLHLTTSGSMEYELAPDGTNKKIGYSLADLALRYLGLDLSDDKSDESWRTHYAELEGVPLDQWPSEATRYAIDDAKHTLAIWQIQEERRREIIEERGHDPFKVLGYRVRLDFALHLMSCHGFAIDAEKVAEIEAMLEEELAPEKMRHMVASGVLRPAEPPREYKTQPGKFTQGKPASINKKRFQEVVTQVCGRAGIELAYTPTGQISTGMEFIQDLTHLSETINEYVHRQKLQKLVTTEIPRMKFEDAVAEVVHPMYDCLKETGRTSSYGSKLVPSLNCQNVDPRVRPCYVARPGRVLFSIDYSQMELGTLAQTCLRLFGHSVMAEKINAGADLHAYLGAQIKATVEGGVVEGTTPDERYEWFTGIKGSDEFKHFRKLAKPTGLGYPGGLGAATFVTYAKATYDVVLTQEMAELLREVWFETFPEMREYFNHINRELVDPWNDEKYCYTTPMGMHRAGADYCAAANGVGLQSPSAEGATLGVCRVSRMCYTPGERFYGKVFPIVFVHDEILGEVEIGSEGLLYDVANIMVESMREITPNVRVSAEPVLMERWDKAAEPVFDEEGKLTVWTTTKS